MKIYSFKCSVAMGNMSTLETDTMKKAMADFLKSFHVKPSICKVRCGESKYDYYYDADISYETSEYLKVLRFSESLRAFCLFWSMSYHEYYLHETERPDHEIPKFEI
ncbi:hypothetical protein [Parabacteroides distasonis]|uniref:hypothetical protein n=1 Tax=Parabacteroides distasonis TaxID=823 RepID=UPI00189F5FEE|nr:hypothetical protein [Parabacteroides distasonis]MDB9154219.1 hypothetical protein [Parabacteroides distasonis]MDB9158727.1 hypothetical protein [Parabacteroides distasonis]MDB9167505.1 hypothetical protein [Parabacteroides distasonis]MDB9172034.1 hypothetical protein [Parabacteroides distasonis]MDB9196249.1 hypothetical protein [Parabacteroides distasonis]